MSTPSRPAAAECPCCGQMIARIWRLQRGQPVGLRFREHYAHCGLPCKLPNERDHPDEVTHVITEECPRCQDRATKSDAYRASTSKIYVDGKVYDRADDPRRFVPIEPMKPKAAKQPPEPKPPWHQIVIPPHAIKSAKIRAGFESAVDAVLMIERLYPLTVYHSSQKTAKGTSHTKRTKPGRNKHKSQRVDLYTVTDNGIGWIFYMKRNVLMTVHRNDAYDFGGPPIDPSKKEET